MENNRKEQMEITIPSADEVKMYLNNRHRLSNYDIPQYIRMLELAKKYNLINSRGVWDFRDYKSQ